MRFLDKMESRQFLAEAVPGSEEDPRDWYDPRVLMDDSRDPAHALLRRSVAGARLLRRLIGESQPTYLWITEHGIWPSLENWHLFNILRAASGEHRHVFDAPGHLFTADEQDDLVSYLQIVIFSGWGGHMVGCETKRHMFISHDSWFVLRGSENDQDYIAEIEPYNLRAMYHTGPR